MATIESGISRHEFIRRINAVLRKHGKYSDTADLFKNGLPVLFADEGIFVYIPILQDSFEGEAGKRPMNFTNFDSLLECAKRYTTNLVVVHEPAGTLFVKSIAEIYRLRQGEIEEEKKEMKLVYSFTMKAPTLAELVACMREYYAEFGQAGEEITNLKYLKYEKAFVATISSYKEQNIV